MKVLGLWFLAACGAGSLLCGCGSSTSSGSVPAPAASALVGNWLIVGPMPTSGLNLSNGFRLAMTFDVTGNNVVAAGYGNDSCNSSSMFSFGFGGVATGTIASDGSFTVQTPGNISAPEAISIKGAVPSANGSPWSGSYTTSFSLPIPPTCDANLAGMFTAISFPLVSGVYTGTASGTANINGVPTTTTMTLKMMLLQQGGTRTDTITGRTVTSNTVLTGSIKVQGSPCFSSGTISNTSSSGVLGNEVLAIFSMDDGSTLELIGYLADASESLISTDILILHGGQCGAGTLPVLYRPLELDRQS